MIRSRSRALVLLAILVLAVPMIVSAGVVTAQDATPVAETAAPPLAEAMPADVQAYAATEFDLESDQYSQLTDLVIRTLIPRSGDTVAAIVDKLVGFIGLLPSDARDVLAGEVGIGATGFQPLDLGSSSDPTSAVESVLPGYAIVLHPNEAGNARQIVEAWYTAQLASAGLEPKRTESGSVVVLENPDPSTASFATNPAVVVFVGDYILLGDSYDEMIPFVDAIQGTAPALADSGDLQSLNSALPTDRLLFGYISGETMTDSATGIFNDSSLAEAIDPPFGVTAFTLAAEEAGLRFESASMPVSGTSLPDDSNTTNPDFANSVPESTLAMFTSEDLGDSWLMAQVEKVLLSVLMSSLGGGEIDLTEVDIDAQFGVLSMLTGVNLKTDLLDPLQGTYGAALFSIDTGNPAASSAVVASELDHPDVVSAGVTTLGPLLQTAGSGDVSITSASIAGQTVTNVTLVGDGQTATIQYGVVNDQLMVGLGDGISTLAEAPASALADNPGYQAALAELPSSYSTLLYVDTQSIARALAPYLIDNLAAGSTNPIVQCLAQNAAGGTPVANEGNMSLTTRTVCSLVGAIFGDNALQDFLVSRVPGPIAAVAYQENGLQRISGILLVDSDQ